MPDPDSKAQCKRNDSLQTPSSLISGSDKAVSNSGDSGQIAVLLKANAVLSTTLTTAEEDIKILVQRLNETETALTDAHDTIFQLQPYHQGITESDAASDFAALLDGIQSWIFTNLGDALDDRRILDNSKIDFVAARDFVGLLTPAGREAMHLPDTDEWNITAVVMRFLMHEVFEKELCGVVPAEQLKFLHGIERSMACLEPRRDLTTTRTWLTTTLHALTSTPHYPSLLPARLKSLATTLARMLRVFSPNQKVTPPLELRQSVLSGIIEPAVALAHRLHLSPHIYALDFSPYAKKYEDSRARNLPSIAEQLWSFEAVDMMRAGRTVKAEDFAITDEAKSHATKEVTYVMDLSPGLFVQSVKGDVLAERRALKKPKIVVAVTEKEKKGKENGNTFPPPFEEDEEGTLVGYLYSRVLHRQQHQAEMERVGFGWIVRQGNGRDNIDR